MNGIGLKKKKVRRDWSGARAKVDEERRCRLCGRTAYRLFSIGLRLEAAHVVARRHDMSEPLRGPESWREGYVSPDRIVPLCGPVGDSRTCHDKYDKHRLDLGHRLTAEEWAQAVADAGSPALAMRRVSPVAYRNNNEAKGE